MFKHFSYYILIFGHDVDDMKIFFFIFFSFGLSGLPTIRYGMIQQAESLKLENCTPSQTIQQTYGISHVNLTGSICEKNKKTAIKYSQKDINSMVMIACRILSRNRCRYVCIVVLILSFTSYHSMHNDTYSFFFFQSFLFSLPVPTPQLLGLGNEFQT